MATAVPGEEDDLYVVDAFEAGDGEAVRGFAVRSRQRHFIYLLEAVDVVEAAAANDTDAQRL